MKREKSNSETEKYSGRRPKRKGGGGARGSIVSRLGLPARWNKDVLCKRKCLPVIKEFIKRTVRTTERSAKCDDLILSGLL